MGLVEVLDALESGCFDRGLQMCGPGTVGVGVALCREVGQCSGGDVFELDAQRDLDYSIVIPHRFGVATVFLLLRDVFSGVVWWGGERERLRGREAPHLCVVVENFVVCG